MCSHFPQLVFCECFSFYHHLPHPLSSFYTLATMVKYSATPCSDVQHPLGPRSSSLILFLCLGRILVAACKHLFVACKFLICSMWDLVPDQGSNTDPLHWELRILASRPPGEVPYFLFLILCLVQFETVSPASPALTHLSYPALCSRIHFLSRGVHS